MKLINVSDIATYSICPLKVYYKLVLEKREKINENIVFGRIKHKFMEKINEVEKEILESVKKNESYESIKKKFNEKYDLIFKSLKEKYEKDIQKFKIEKRVEEEIERIKKEEAEIRAKTAIKFVNLGFYGEELYNVAPKFLCEYEIKSFVLGIKGRIDKIRIDKEIELYEIKSRSYNNKIWLSEKLQVCGYAMLAERKFKTNIDYGFLKFKDKVVKVEITNSLRELLTELKREIEEMVKNRIKPEKKEIACGNCGFSEICIKC
jgi:CRISPR-associated protein Cas4